MKSESSLFFRWKNKNPNPPVGGCNEDVQGTTVGFIKKYTYNHSFRHPIDSTYS
jgi:hypothetical protein